MISAMQGVLGLASGALVGFSLGLVGGGGSILAVPLMVYVVGVPDAHVAIGTSAIAVAANAAVNLSNHARGGTVVWSCALVFAGGGHHRRVRRIDLRQDGRRPEAAGAVRAADAGDRHADAEDAVRGSALPDVKMSWPTCPPSSASVLRPGRCPASSASAADF